MSINIQEQAHLQKLDHLVEDDHLILITYRYVHGHLRSSSSDTMDQDFVSFGRSPSPAPSNSTALSAATSQNAKAGPSRSKPENGTPKGPKSKKRPRSKDDEGPGPRNLKEEKKARDRSAPWCQSVDWSDCRDPAEMRVTSELCRWRTDESG